MKFASLTNRLLLLGLITALPHFLTRSAVAEEVLVPDGWPKTYEVAGSEIAIYMPQILEWTEFRHIKATAAIGLKLPGSEEATFGAVAFEADTVADFDRGTVMIEKRTFSDFRFPELNEADTAKAKELLQSVISPESPMDLSLASVTAALERSDASIAETEVSLDAPPIFYSDSPASLVVFIGTPRLEPVLSDDPSLMFAVNTNWDVLFAEGKYFLLNGSQWQTADDPIAGPWAAVTELPDSFKKLPDDGNWSDVKANLTILFDASPAPKVFASDRPAEIVVTEGKPQMMPVSGTSLFYVANTESELFFETKTKAYYLLVTGRWFRAQTLSGGWSPASEDLPADFAKIPGGHPMSAILASVKGTAEADEAVILASIPQTATVDRATTTLAVAYDGDPEFKPVPGSASVQFAINTSYDVFLVEGAYYCCYQGVWFQAESPAGPWAVCDKVPDPIYSIPTESPKYNVTHVHVYESTDDTVKVGTTSGYSGNYVANGVVMFGLGMWAGQELAEDTWHGAYYPPASWYGYGCGAVYHSGQGYYQSGARYYGPYGGAGYSAVYDPSTGVYSRGAYAYGPRGVAGARSAYNPWTDTGAGRAAVSTPYGSWGRSAVVRDDDWARAGHRSNAYGTVAGVQTSKGGGVVGVNRKYGPDAFAGETGAGDVYVGRDGNIYKKDSGEDWQKRQDGGWQNASDLAAANPPPAEKRVAPTPRESVTRPASPSDRPEQAEKRTAAPASRPASAENARASYSNRQTTSSQLSRDSYSRQRSASSSQRSSPSRGSGGSNRRRR